MPENFRYPYVAQSAHEFWKRWHITLTIYFTQTIKARQTRGFSEHIFAVPRGPKGKVSMVIQTIAEGILHKKAEFWNAPEVIEAATVAHPE